MVKDFFECSPFWWRNTLDSRICQGLWFIANPDSCRVWVVYGWYKPIMEKSMGTFVRNYHWNTYHVSVYNIYIYSIYDIYIYTLAFRTSKKRWVRCKTLGLSWKTWFLLKPWFCKLSFSHHFWIISSPAHLKVPNSESWSKGMEFE